MMSGARRVVILGVVAVGVLLVPSGAWADGSAGGPAFGEHVVHCAQTMGFDGEHNPGMHRGFAGWDPSHVC
jgi:hypothetical protein